MAASITQHPFDTAKTVEDKVRALPANQGKNDNALWLLIDAEINQSSSDGKLVGGTGGKDKHGGK